MNAIVAAHVHHTYQYQLYHLFSTMTNSDTYSTNLPTGQ